MRDSDYGLDATDLGGAVTVLDTGGGWTLVVAGPLVAADE